MGYKIHTARDESRIVTSVEEAQRIRSEVEPKYGEAKVWHGLGRARWRERWRETS